MLGHPKCCEGNGYAFGNKQTWRLKGLQAGRHIRFFMGTTFPQTLGIFNKLSEGFWEILYRPLGVATTILMEEIWLSTWDV